MIKGKAARKQKMKTFLAFGVIGLSLLLAGSIFAQYVPQEIGFKDVKFTSLKKEMCQECHGDSLVEDHHSTSDAVAGNCVVCHGVQTEPGNVGVSLERNCMVCHNESPHHTIEPAKNRECTACHDSPGVSDYSTEVPSYPISNITPTVADCRLCHGEGILDGVQIVDSRDTHHDISFKECKVCHGEIDLPEEERNEEGSTDIRICERCHNVEALHEVVPHVEENACAVCHGGKTVTTQPAVEETEQPESGETEQPEGGETEQPEGE